MNIFDWTQISDDPNNSEAKQTVRTLLPRLRQIHTDIDLIGYMEQVVRGKRVLDIGVVSHSARYFDEPGWRHGRIAAAAGYCLGIDILKPLVEKLRNKGFNVVCMDATSDADIGERFDVIFIGDVIEHVENPAALLRFSARHLSDDGRLLVATPNPFSRKFVRQFQREGIMVVNLDHVAWFTPTMALELARRCNLHFSAYHLTKPYSGLRLFVKRLMWRIGLARVEYSFPDHLFEFTLPNTAKNRAG